MTSISCEPSAMRSAIFGGRRDERCARVQNANIQRTSLTRQQGASGRAHRRGSAVAPVGSRAYRRRPPLGKVVVLHVRRRRDGARRLARRQRDRSRWPNYMAGRRAHAEGGRGKVRAVVQRGRRRPAESTWTLDSADDVQKLGGHLDANGTDVVVLDSFRRFSTADENSSQSVADALNQVRALACSQETGAANRLVAVIHHLGRNGLPRGSTDFTAVVDSTLRVERRAGGWRLRAEHHGAAPFSCDAVVTETDEVLHVEDFLPLACAQGPLGTAALRKRTRACGGSAKNGHIDARVAELVLTGAVRTQAGPRGSVLHTLAPPP